MPRRRRSSGWGYFPLALLLLLLLLMVTGVLQVRISPQVNLPPQVHVPSDQVHNLDVLIAELAHAISQEIPGLQIALPTGTPAPNNPAAAPPPGIGHRTKTSGCVSQGSLPDSACTPGAVFSSATKDQICTPGYSPSVRDVPNSVKDMVYAEYGITQHREGEYEVDHLVPLELGGSNDIANLWPEPASPSPGFHEKDQVENDMHDQVCSGAIPLQQAQDEIATNWLKVYKQLPSR